MTVTEADVSLHNTQESCWLIIHGRVYDVTAFLAEHPGGAEVLLSHAGQDATQVFDTIHSLDMLQRHLPLSAHLGPVTPRAKLEQTPPAKATKGIQQHGRSLQALEQCLNLDDFEVAARRVMRSAGWAYYSSGADDEVSMRENVAAFHRIFFQPRILQDVTNVEISTEFLGRRVAVPFYVTATALGKLGHPEGEIVLTRAAAKHGAVQMIPTLGSCSLEEVMSAADGVQIQWLQLYVNRDRGITKEIVQTAEKRGCKALVITVDAPQLGRREKDMRTKYTGAISDIQSRRGNGQYVDRSSGAAMAISGFIDSSLTWHDLTWLRSITTMPIVLKGVQREEDVLRAVASGCVQGVVLSNHGGRQLDFSRSGIEILAKVMPVLRKRGLQDAIEIYVDGGIRRGTDILKALCLGARGVGIGRPFLYAMSTFGEPGVVRAMQLLKDELEMGMRLLGVTRVGELGPSLVDASQVGQRAVAPPVDWKGGTGCAQPIYFAGTAKL